MATPYGWTERLLELRPMMKKKSSAAPGRRGGTGSGPRASRRGLSSFDRVSLRGRYSAATGTVALRVRAPLRAAWRSRRLGVSDLCQIRLTIVAHSGQLAESQTAQRSRSDMR